MAQGMLQHRWLRARESAAPKDEAGEFERRAAHGYHHHEKGHIQRYGEYMNGVTALVESLAGSSAALVFSAARAAAAAARVSALNRLMARGAGALVGGHRAAYRWRARGRARRGGAGAADGPSRSKRWLI